MESGDTERKKLQAQVPWIPTTPCKPVLPSPVPIWTPGQGNQLGSHFNGMSYHRSEPTAATHYNAKTPMQISFDNISSSSNGIAELLAPTHVPPAYSNPTHDAELLAPTHVPPAYSNATHDAFYNNQFAPTFGSQFDPTYALFNHNQLSCELPLMDTIHNKYQDLQGTSYFAYCSKTPPQITPPTLHAITTETRHNAGTQMNMEERDQEGEEKNVPTTITNPHNKFHDSVTEVAAAFTPCKDNHNHNIEISHDIDLNKTPPKPRRRKHRPKVITEGTSKRTRKQVTPKPVQPKGNSTGKRKPRKGLNPTSTPQTEVTGECTKPFMPESAKKTCRRSLNFDIGEQRDDDTACRENTTMKFGRRNEIVVEETQANCASGDMQAPNTYLSKNNSPGAKQNANSVESSSQILSTGSGSQVLGSKRKHSGIEHADNSSINLNGAQYNAVQAYSQKYWIQFPNVQRKRRSGKGRISNMSYTSSATATKNVQLETCPQDVRTHSYASSPNFRTTGFECNAVRVPDIIAATERAIRDKPQLFEYNLPIGKKRPTKRRSRVPTRIHDCTSRTLNGNRDAKVAHTAKHISSDRKTFGDAETPQTCIEALVAEIRASLTKKKRTNKRRIVNSAHSLDVAGEEIWKNIHTVDDLTERFIHLSIYREAGELVLHQHNALVPCNQQDQNDEHGAIIPIKKQHRRPKVELDDETTKVWNLLMLDINSHGIDGTDENKAKWWEEERNIFHGRADSFIARMHLVQGDRRFSPWKGSVVDSVVGVFLTQNVADHLSSSAFMSLAARFPLKSSNKTCHNESTTLIVSEPQMHIIEHAEEREAVDSNDSCGTTGSLISLTDESNYKLLESAQRHNREHSPVESGQIGAVTGEGQENLHHGSAEKKLNAVTSHSIDQTTEKIASFSASNSEVEDLSSTAKYNIFYNRTPFSKLLEMASSTMLHEVNVQRSKYIGMKHDDQAQNLEKSNVGQGASITNEYTLKMTPNSGVALKIEVPSSGCPEDKDENDERSSFPTKSNSQAATAHSQGQTQEPTQKVRKGKGRRKQKNKNFNWDSLRIQAQAKAGKREKTENTMDSLDWDAVRCADVNEISDTIRERGMNNMLAERIQNFLNLLVDVHGAIDLEWLRDVPPDQAKEYLLSIKGLGLKSVECVRLLTLHHLAFPVDTNVGRIAVRLGWVPLQPLPESLQLHLLELYPVLESIQKYLWPRLCKLDQRTLYELHYQMITFGKVFCTKNKPNCNACPMRGDCRHFASAFASARLTLPGPEQKSVVTTTGNNTTGQNSSVVINQLPLLLPENTTQVEELQQTEVIQQLEAKSETNISQPIIEEPETPEPECFQVSENDIEDIFYEEPCEIPTIKLNIEEFTLNLQNYMQENMELQEGEMSKALVAIHPDAASIPTPKLKNMSRLRTEHQVYELPDTHPLLKGWDKREADDPGKYLLAIWTPGEMADSIQLPERKCSFQDSGQLCNEKECFSCNSFREANSQIVRGTLLIPCRTATRGSFPLNGTYFQVNEVFADHASSLDPINVPRSWIWNLNRRTVYFGTSISSIFKGLSTREIQQCFWRGYVCVRGFDREMQAPRPLLARLHFSASKLPKNKGRTKKQSRQPKSQRLNLKSNP